MCETDLDRVTIAVKDYCQWQDDVYDVGEREGLVKREPLYKYYFLYVMTW